MFTHATEGVSILSSLESVSTFGRVYLDEFICPELTELVHFVSCIALMQMYFNDFSMIQTICAISAFFVAAIYQVLRILITPIIFIVCRVFYLSCAAANSRASRTVTRNNHESNIESLDMILYNTASTSLISTPFNVHFMSYRISSALDNFIVNGKRILIGYPGIENLSPSRVLVTISKRHTNSYIIDSSTSHAKWLNILCEITRRGVDLQQEMFIRTYLMTAMLPKEIIHTFRAYQMPMIEEGARITEIDETDVFTTANESASLSGLIEDCESVNAANEPISLQGVPSELLLLEPFTAPETAIIDEGARHISETVDILEPALGPSSSTSTNTPISEKDAESINSTVKPELALFAVDDIDFDFDLTESCPVERVPTERIGATTNILVTDDIDFDFGLSEPYPIERVSVASTQDETTGDCDIGDDRSRTLSSEIPEHPAQIPTGQALIQSEVWSMLPNGQANPVFFNEMSFFYNGIFSDNCHFGKSTEITQERVLNSLNIFKSLSEHIVHLSEQFNTSRGARVEGCFRPWNEAIHEDPMKYLSLYCYNDGCMNLERYQKEDPDVPDEELAPMLENYLFKHETLADGRIATCLVSFMFEAYEFGVIEEAKSGDFMMDIQKTFNENCVTADVEWCINYLSMEIAKIEHNSPINVTSLRRILTLYKPLRKISLKYDKKSKREELYMKRYRDFMITANSMDIEKEYRICKERIDDFSTLSKDSFNSRLYASRIKWDIKKADKLELQDLRKEMYPHQRIRKRDTFRLLWRNLMRWKQ